MNDTQETLDIIQSIEINAPCERMFDYLCNPNSWPEWLFDSQRIEAPYRVLEAGEKFYEYYKGPEGFIDVYWRVKTCDRPRRWEIETYVEIAGPY